LTAVSPNLVFVNALDAFAEIGEWISPAKYASSTSQKGSNNQLAIAGVRQDDRSNSARACVQLPRNLDPLRRTMIYIGTKYYYVGPETEDCRQHFGRNQGGNYIETWFADEHVRKQLASHVGSIGHKDA
jgi:hypothetical protein